MSQISWHLNRKLSHGKSNKQTVHSHIKFWLPCTLDAMTWKKSCMMTIFYSSPWSFNSICTPLYTSSDAHRFILIYRFKAIAVAIFPFLSFSAMSPISWESTLIYICVLILQPLHSLVIFILPWMSCEFSRVICTVVSRDFSHFLSSTMNMSTERVLFVYCSFQRNLFY